MKKHNTFEKVFPSGLHMVKTVVSETIEHLRGESIVITSDDECELRLILSELLFNAVIHGNKGDAGKHVRCHVEIDDETFRCMITDEGTGFDYSDVLQGYDSDDNLIKEHGRGLRLAHTLSDKLDFNDSGNTVTVYKRMSRNG